jgi:GNAT superfamily N-acetyltransferase
MSSIGERGSSCWLASERALFKRRREGAMRVEVREAAADELGWANARYAEVQFLPSSPADLIAVAEVMGEPAGLGRLVPVDACAEELGGIYVFPRFRSLGVSKAIIAFLVRRSRKDDLYCLPFCNLVHLYASFGFSAVRENHAVPLQVKRKHIWCNERYSTPVLLLGRRRCDKSGTRRAPHLGAPHLGGGGVSEGELPPSETRSSTAVASSTGLSRG